MDREAHADTRDSAPSASTPARSPIRRPAPSSRRSTRRRPTCRRRSASTRATSTRARRTRRAWRSKRNLAAIEGGKAGFAFASGMAAIGAIATLLEVRRSRRRLRQHLRRHVPAVRQVLTRYQLTFTYVDTSNLDDVERAIHAGDADAVRRDADQPGDAAHRPARPRPSSRTATTRGWSSTTRSPARTSSGRSSSAPTWSSHSTTKYLNGHSDSVGGVVVAVRDDDIEWLRFVQNAEGAILEPVRFVAGAARHQDAAAADGSSTTPTAWRSPSSSAAHPKVQHVYYPGLPSHPQHELAKRQMRGFGGMLAFELGSLEAARRAARTACGCMALAESLGGVETLISHPATMTHASVPAERRAAIGITDGLVRISAGIEDIEDLKDDLAQALDRGLMAALIDFVLHFDKHLLEFVATYGVVGLRDPVRDRLRRDRLRGHAVSAGRLAAVRGRRAVRRPARSSTPVAVRAAGRSRRSPATPSTTRSAASIGPRVFTATIDRAVAPAAEPRVPRSGRTRSSSSTAARRSSSGASCRSCGRSCRSSPARRR